MLLNILFINLHISLLQINAELTAIEIVELIEFGSHLTEDSLISYHLYTQLNPNVERAQKIYNNNISALQDSASPFDSSRRTIFVCHGWTGEYDDKINRQITSAILSQANWNVFVVDWSRLADENYAASRYHVEDVGNYIGQFINLMQRIFNMSGSRFVLAGHSLGAHVVGIAGKRMEQKADYLIALDPARPLFEYELPDHRLYRTDARVVQVIHTNGALLAFIWPFGTADFYPNGGFVQPGCLNDKEGGCSHRRAYEYFAESIVRGSVFVGWPCKLECVLLNTCKLGEAFCRVKNKPDSYMGTLDIDETASGFYYFDTNSKPPYGRS